ncbi:imidazolonepropionase [Maricaulaceae bacterium NA33B04]|nr:imidazolonepropionase [Maricaulaceae bacterium NA33B04]
MSSSSSSTLVLRQGRIATLAGDGGYGLIEEGEIVIADGRVAAVGITGSCRVPGGPHEIVDLEGRLVTPGLIDCHTHLVHGGSRAREFELRLEGASYEDIARAGGGIFSTVEATRAASEEALLLGTLDRLDHFLAEGVTTLEVKSGYGLDLETERKMLRVARQLSDHRAVRIKTTFLGAHAVPRGMDADTYIDDVCRPALRRLASEGLIDAVDGFCEGIGFTPAQIARVFEDATSLDLPVKLHAEQLSALGGSALAAQNGALSADHLEYATKADIRAMADAGTVAVMLPGAFYYLRETQKPPVDALRQAGVPMAVASDYNPGSSPMTSIVLAMNMAATFFGLTPLEALRGVTVNAARALGLRDVGCIAPGQVADLAVWDFADPAELTYRIGGLKAYLRIVGGVVC